MSAMTHEFFAQLVSETRETLRRYVRKIVRSDESTEEIMQEAFLRTYEKGGALHIPQAFLFSTAHNLAIDQFRRELNSPVDSVGDVAESDVIGAEAGLDEILLADESSRILKRAIERLTPQQQAAVTLKIFYGYSYKEIGSLLGISWKTVEQHITKGTASIHTYVLARYNGGQNG